MRVKFSTDLACRFGLQDNKPVYNQVATGDKLTRNDEDKRLDFTYFKQIVGSLMYLNATRPDIMYIVSLISKFMDKPTEKHLIAAKCVLRYFEGNNWSRNFL